jgi:hypothetical protein
LPCCLSLGAGSVFHHPPPTPCQCVMMVRCLFFNFVGQFDFGCYLLAQEMSSVILYLPCFGEWLIAHLLSAFLPTVCAKISSLLLSCALSAFPPPLLLYYITVVYCSVFFWGGGQSAQGLCWFIPGVAGGILHDAWCSSVWSVERLAGRFGASGGS